jgi:hypothetical protein
MDRQEKLNVNNSVEPKYYSSDKLLGHLIHKLLSSIHPTESQGLGQNSGL